MPRYDDVRSWLSEKAQEAAEAAERKLSAELYARATKPEDYRQVPCPQCGQLLYNRDDHPAYKACTCMIAARYTAFEAAKADLWPEAVASQWTRTGLPPRYQDASFATFKARPGTDDAVAACRSYAAEFDLDKTTTGLLLAGTYGSGKTHLALATARVLVERTLARVVFTSPGDMLQKYKASGFDDSILEAAAKAEFLIFDDLGQDVPSPHDRAHLFSIINSRHDHFRPTIFTTNNGPKQMNDVLGGSIVDRLRIMTELVKVEATSYRRGD